MPASTPSYHGFPDPYPRSCCCTIHSPPPSSSVCPKYSLHPSGRVDGGRRKDVDAAMLLPPLARAGSRLCIFVHAQHSSSRNLSYAHSDVRVSSAAHAQWEHDGLGVRSVDPVPPRRESNFWLSCSPSNCIAPLSLPPPFLNPVKTNSFSTYSVAHDTNARQTKV